MKSVEEIDRAVDGFLNVTGKSGTVRSGVTLTPDERHPSLHFKSVGRFWWVRVTDAIRALAVREGDDYVWVWIGTHDEYDRRKTFDTLMDIQFPLEDLFPETNVDLVLEDAPKPAIRDRILSEARDLA